MSHSFDDSTKNDPVVFDDRSNIEGHCPVSGLPIYGKPEWTDVECGDDFRLTVKIIGNNIIWSRPYGVGRLNDIRNSTYFIDKVVEDYFPEKKEYIQIEDYTHLLSATLNGRKFFVDHMKKRPYILGIIFCGVAPMLEMSIKLAAKLNIVKYDVKIASDYQDAIRIAQTISNGSKSQFSRSHGKEMDFITHEYPKKEATSFQKIINTPHVSSNLDLSHKYIEELMEYLGNINWQESGFNVEKKIDPSNPLNPILDGIALIKGDLDDLFHEHAKTVEKLRNAQEDLEKRVHERTVELIKTNNDLLDSKERYRNLYNDSKKAEEVYRSLLYSCADAVIILDLEEKVKYISPEFTQIFGWTIEDIKGQSIQFVPDSEKERTFISDKKLVENGIPLHNFVTRRYSKDGNLLDVSISASRYNDHQGKPAGILKIFRDISERIKLMDRLQEAQKTEAVATLAGGVAHEFNNALMGVSGNIEVIQMEYHNDQKILHHTESIKDSIYRMARLTQQLLAYARGGKFLARYVSVNEIIMEIMPILKQKGTTAISFQIDLQRGLPRIKADITQIQMAISSVINNAKEAIENEGQISISTRREEFTQDPETDSLGLDPGQYVLITIEDNGRGMDVETKTRIFDPFFTTKFQGRGLGMAAVYGIIKNHNGSICIDSRLDQGTEVKIYLPIYEEELKDKKPAEPRLKRLKKGSATILFIEDEEVFIDLGKTILEKFGYRVLVAKTGKKAIETVKNFNGDIDLALLDIKLPDMDGDMIYPLIMEERPDLKVIVCSGYSIDGAARKIIDSGAKGFIQKPFSFIELSEKIQKILSAP